MSVEPFDMGTLKANIPKHHCSTAVNSWAFKTNMAVPYYLTAFKILKFMMNLHSYAWFSSILISVKERMNFMRCSLKSATQIWRECKYTDRQDYMKLYYIENTFWNSTRLEACCNRERDNEPHKHRIWGGAGCMRWAIQWSLTVRKTGCTTIYKKEHMSPTIEVILVLCLALWRPRWGIICCSKHLKKIWRPRKEKSRNNKEI